MTEKIISIIKLQTDTIFSPSWLCLSSDMSVAAKLVEMVIQSFRDHFQGGTGVGSMFESIGLTIQAILSSVTILVFVGTVFIISLNALF